MIILKLKLREDGFFSQQVYIYIVEKCTSKQKTLMDSIGKNALKTNQTYPIYFEMLEIITMFAFKAYSSAF